MSASKTILIVDDDPDILEQLALVLRADGYTVVAANGYEAAQEQLLSVRPDLAVIDLMMEHMDSGFVLGRDIRHLYPGTPIVLLTAVRAATGLSFKSGSAEARSWVQADCIMDKPVRPEHLRSEIRRLLGTPPAQDQTNGGGH